jgi:radial spoke head protein 1
MWPDGSVYTGQFTNDEIHGQGVYFFVDGRTYSGEWKNN